MLCNLLLRRSFASSLDTANQRLAAGEMHKKKL